MALSDSDQMFPETTPPGGSQRGGGGGGDGDVEAGQRARSEVKGRIVRAGVWVETLIGDRRRRTRQ